LSKSRPRLSGSRLEWTIKLISASTLNSHGVFHLRLDLRADQPVAHRIPKMRVPEVRAILALHAELVSERLSGRDGALP
jgi:hypothetical protein